MTVVLVTGSRSFSNRQVIEGALSEYGPGDTLIHGGAPGADRIAASAAKALGMTVIEYRAQWERYGRSAGPRRNQEMLDSESPDIVIAFPLADSVGTWDMVNRASRAGVEVRIY